MAGHSAIFGRDDREYASASRGSPYAPVGIVLRHVITRFHPYTVATGFLVDDCHVLTSQGAMNGKKSPVGSHLRFRSGLGTPYYRSTRGTIVAFGGQTERIRTTESQMEGGARDWLLLRLDQCVGKTLGHVALKTGPFSPYEFRDLSSASYPRDRGKARGVTIDPSCMLLRTRGPMWVNDCALARGDAGAPIFRIAVTGATHQMVVYAMQSTGHLTNTPVQAASGYENQAIPMSVIAPQIERYLSVAPPGELMAGR
jgi:hypothetical protein